MTIKCASCGRFISYKDIKEKKATYYYEPESDRGHEIEEWTHKRCYND